jgi:hypothetical protein
MRRQAEWTACSIEVASLIPPRAASDPFTRRARLNAPLMPPDSVMKGTTWKMEGGAGVHPRCPFSVAQRPRERSNARVVPPVSHGWHPGVRATGAKTSLQVFSSAV